MKKLLAGVLFVALLFGCAGMTPVAVPDEIGRVYDGRVKPIHLADGHTTTTTIWFDSLQSSAKRIGKVDVTATRTGDTITVKCKSDLKVKNFIRFTLVITDANKVITHLVRVKVEPVDFGKTLPEFTANFPYFSGMHFAIYFTRY